MTPQTPSNEGTHPVYRTQESEMLVTALTSFTSLYSSSTIGMLAIGGLVRYFIISLPRTIEENGVSATVLNGFQTSLQVAKSAGWKIIAICGAVYGLVYVYERLTWTNKAKERAFKRQYVDYAASKLKLIIDLTSANCSHQVEQ